MNRRKLVSAIRTHLTLPGVATTPAGMTPDPSANFGLFALQANANLRLGGQTNITTAGTDTLLTVAQLFSRVIFLAAGASGGFTITLPSTVDIIAGAGPTVPKDGSFITLLSIVNVAVGQTGTITAGDVSTTVTGTATIATNTTRTVAIKIASGTTVTVTNMGSMAI